MSGTFQFDIPSCDGDHAGLYHRYGFALNSAGIDLWAVDQFGNGSTPGAPLPALAVPTLVLHGGRLDHRVRQRADVTA